MGAVWGIIGGWRGGAGRCVATWDGGGMSEISRGEKGKRHGWVDEDNEERIHGGIADDSGNGGGGMGCGG